MDLKKLVAVSGMAGVFKLVSNRSNGLIVQDFDTLKKKFVSSRKHQFTPLETISIYTEDDETSELKEVFQGMLDQIEERPPVSTSASPDEIRAYFETVLPNFDKERVYLSDIKKLIKWFNFLNQRDLFVPEEEEAEVETTTEEEA